MSIPVIITRAEPGASKTFKGVGALGLQPILSPALILQADPDVDLPDVNGLSGVIFTSANGARFYAERENDRGLTAWCVGPATARAARDVGFEEVEESSGNASALAATIASTIAPPEKPLLHVANSAAKGDLQRELKMRRYKVKFAPLYRAMTAPGLSPEAQSLLQTKTPGIVLVHSAKGSDAFLELVADHSHAGLSVVAISSLAAAPLEAAGLTNIHIATTPNERSLMDALKQAAATLST